MRVGLSPADEARIATLPYVSAFAFEIRDVLVFDERDTRITLIEPVVDSKLGLSVGDSISVPLSTGATSICQCLAFPLVNLGHDRTAWVRVSIDGVAPGLVLIGGNAIRQP
jgi:hypothetical protein